jgi:hypothetical protein
MTISMTCMAGALSCAARPAPVARRATGADVECVGVLGQQSVTYQSPVLSRPLGPPTHVQLTRLTRTGVRRDHELLVPITAA